MPRGRPPEPGGESGEAGAEADDVLTPNTEGGNFPYQVPNFHKCEICLLSFPRETQFQRHMRDHEQNDKPHRCDQCPMSFNVEFNLTLHKCTHNGEDPTCPVCNKKFSRVASLKAHIMLHEKEENLICSECGDEFTLQSQLSIHMEEHRQELAGSRIHSCKSCKKEFETSSQLKEHMKTHYKIRVSNTRSYNRNIDRSGFTYSCPHCGKTFQKPSQLTRHVRIHTGERPFKCSECGKAFNQKGALQTHMIKHTGEKPHACAFCPAAFSQKGNLQSHIQRVHSEDSVTQPLTTSPANLLQPVDNKWKNATHFRSPLLQQTENQVSPAAAHQGQQTVTDVIQQLLELSEPGPVENNQPQQPGQQLNIAVGISRDILQQALENSGLSSIPVSAHSTDCSQAKAAGAQDQNPDVPSLSNHQADSNSAEHDKEQDSTDKLDKKEKKFIKKKSPFLPGVRPFACPHCDKKFRTSGHRKTHITSHFKHTELRKLRHQRKPAKVRVGKSSGPVPDIPLQEPILITDLGLIQPIPRNSQVFQNYFNSNFVNNAERPYKCYYCHRAYKKSCHLKQHIRYELAQQLQQNQQSSSIDDSTVDQQSIHVSTQMQVEIQSDELQQSETVTTDQQAILELDQQPVVGTEEAALEQELADQPLEQDEDRFVTSQHALQENITQFEQQTITQQPFDQQSLSQDSQLFEVSLKILEPFKIFEFQVGVKAFSCSICNTSFTTNGSLTRHMATHMSMKPYKCPFCDESFRTTVHCKKHMKKHQAVSSAVAAATDTGGGVACVEDDEESSERTSRKSRPGVITFTEEETAELAKIRPQESATVSEKVLVQSAAEKDRISEIKDKQAELEAEPKYANCCSYCPKSFKKPSDLVRHVRIHTGEKPYKCDECGKSFTVKSTLDCHVKTHTDPNVFIMNNSVLTNQFDQNLLQQGLVGQAILPASVSAGGDLTVSLTDGSLATLEGIQLQLAANLVGQNVQISGIDATGINNITLQIDPSILQQTLQQSNLLTQQLTGDPTMAPQNPSLQAPENAVPANVVIQPISGLSLQPTVTSANMTIGSLSEQESVLTTSASGAQDITQVMTSQGMVSSTNGQHEIMLTINNSSLSQVLAHASGSATATSSGSPQEITLTISGQDLIQHNSGSTDLNTGLRLTAPTINSQTTGATLTISNDQLLSQGPSLNAPELNTTGGTNLPPATPISQSAVSAQNLVMSSSGVGGDGSVTLTLADTQGMLSGGLDAVTLNITSQGQQFPAILTDSSLGSQSGSGSQQVILVSHTPHSEPANSDEITYQVAEVSPNVSKSSQAEKETRGHQCFECSQTFYSVTMLTHHCKEVHGKERIHVCHICNKAFKRATHLKEHMQTHQGGPSLSSQKPRVFKCDTCEKAFAKPSQLERHSRIHTGERPFQCTLCEKAFNQKSALKVHMKRHTGERPYKCDYCAMGFTQKSNMKLHMKRAHGYTGPVQEPVSHQEQEGEDISRALNLEEVVQESSNEWQSIGNVFR
ncbi:hypothetical protein DUI87_07885 [Hirundo rustica rustica]|uniref:C2H2-type domain-containing protein n=1 Tax=Hirundo rustica rustica TaxID=333673 RepID=A0A3M0KRC8_HIRRU|nr:hypothetical protein DUI87_07885 [Hirundo rustica rustica]